MDSFSWMDNLRAAVGTCLPCFAFFLRSTSDSEEEPARATAIGRQTRFDELEGLLGNADDADTMSLHSNIGQGQQRRRKKRRTRKNIQLFGFNLFGRPAIQLPQSDDEDSLDSLRRRNSALGLTPSAHSSSSGSAFDEDAVSIDPAYISHLTAQAAAERAEDLDRVRRAEEQRRKEEREEREERRQRRKERKALNRMATAIAHGTATTLGGEEFEGFQGSGDFVAHPMPETPAHALTGPFEEFGAYVGGPVSAAGPSDDHADTDADFGGEVYVRKQRRHGSESSRSQTRSRSSASNSNAGSSPAVNHHFISSYPLSSPVAYPQSPSDSSPRVVPAPAKERKEKKKVTLPSHIPSPPTSQSASLPSLDSPTAKKPTLLEPRIVGESGRLFSPTHDSSAFAAMQEGKFPVVGSTD